jgi:hypothetical protein
VARWTLLPSLRITVAELRRSDEGEWTLHLGEDADDADRNEAHDEALPRYLTAVDPAFSDAEGACESEFVKGLLRIGSMQDAGWDPYETTLVAIPAMIALHARIPGAETPENYAASRHLVSLDLRPHHRGVRSLRGHRGHARHFAGVDVIRAYRARTALDAACVTREAAAESATPGVLAAVPTRVAAPRPHHPPAALRALDGVFPRVEERRLAGG